MTDQALGTARVPVPHPEPDADELVPGLAQIWAEVLGVDAVASDADLLELGGNSLQAARILARVRAGWAADLTLRELFEAGTVLRTAKLVAGRRHRPANRPGGGPPPLHRSAAALPVPAPQQQRLWFLDHLSDAAGLAYNVPVAARVRGPLDVAALRDAVADVVQRHEQLRTAFRLVDGDLVAVLTDQTPQVRLVDLRGHADPDAEAQRQAQRLAAEHLDLAVAPLLRCTVLRLRDDEHLVVLVLSHLVSDGLTVDVLDRDLAAAYRARRAGMPAPASEAPLRYRDYAHWRRSLTGTAYVTGLLDHWREHLRGVNPVLDLPADRGRPAVRSHRGRRVTVRTPDGLGSAVRALAAATGATPYAVFLAGFAAELRRLTGRRDLLVATPTAGRPDPALEDVVGFFTNTLLVRLRPGTGTFRDLIVATHATVLDGLEHQEVPFEQLVAELAPPGDLSRPPLAQVALAYQGVRRPHAALADALVEPVAVDNGTAKFDLTLEVHETGDDFEITAEYSTDLFEQPRAWAMVQGLVDLLGAAAADPDRSLTELVSGRRAQRRSVADWNGRCLHEIFAEAAQRAPDVVAVDDGDRRLTYRELDRAANRVAHRLRRAGAGPEVLVGVCAERTVGLIVGVLAVLKAGAGYLPLDPRHPAARLELTLDDAGCRLVVGDADRCAPLLGADRTFLDLAEPYDDEPDTAPDTAVRPEHTAYVIYTSGSTGRPKGVVVTHANVTRLFTATDDDFGFGPDDVWTLFHSIAFDFSVWELWGALLYGGRLVVVPYVVSRDPEAFLELLRAEQVTVLNQTPTAFRQLAGVAEDAGHPPTSLRYVVFGGEALGPATLRSWVAGYGADRPRLINMYGITETTVHVTYRPIGVADLAGSISPIGRPIADLRVLVLDENLREVPSGVEGEMFVGGPGVARGYLNRPELTAQRFLADPYGGPGDRLYRSGDLAVRRPDGELEYRGRADDQVKIHGFRIELGEIERAMLDRPGVRAAACMLREDTPGLPRLVGYLVPVPGGTLDRAGLRAALQDRLPAHMVPAVLVTVPSLPLTANGKLDRSRLPRPEPAEEQAGAARHRPRTPQEHTLAAAWSQVLGVDDPDVHDNFFAVGGDSIVAIRLGAAARAAGLPITIEQIFLHPTIAGLAQARRRTPAQDGPAATKLSTTLSDLDVTALPPGVTDAYPTAAMQLAILFECELTDTVGLYHDALAVRVDGRFDWAALQRALTTLVARHDILRTSFNLGLFREPVQLVHRTAEVTLTVDEDAAASWADDEPAATVLQDWWRRETSQPFDPGEPPLLRCHVLRRAPSSFHLCLAVHHSVLDGWSLARLMTELLLAYDRQLGGADSGLPAAPATRYRDFVVAEQAAAQDATAERHWRDILAAHPAAPLPVRPGAADPYRFELPEHLDEALRRAAAAAQLPVKSVFLAAHLWALRQLTGPDVVAGVQVNGRLEHPDADQVLGLFLNIVPVGCRVDGGTWHELMHAVFEVERRSQPYRRYPLAQMRQLTGRSPFEVAFNYTDFHTFTELDALERVGTRNWWSADRHSFPLLVEVVTEPRTARRCVLVSAGVDSPLSATGAELGGLLRTALERIAANPEGTYPVAAPAAERGEA